MKRHFLFFLISFFLVTISAEDLKGPCGIPFESSQETAKQILLSKGWTLEETPIASENAFAMTGIYADKSALLTLGFSDNKLYLINVMIVEDLPEEKYYKTLAFINFFLRNNGFKLQQLTTDEFISYYVNSQNILVTLYTRFFPDRNDGFIWMRYDSTADKNQINSYNQKNREIFEKLPAQEKQKALDTM